MSAFANFASNVSALKNKASEATATLESIKAAGLAKIDETKAAAGNALSVVQTPPPSESLPPTVTATGSQPPAPSGAPPPPGGGSPIVNPASQPPAPSISAGLDNALKTVNDGEQKDEYCGEMTKAFIAAFGKILETGSNLPERALLVDFIQNQIKEYETKLIPAIAKSLQIDASRQQYFLKKLGKAMDMKKNIRVGGGGRKTRSKNKPSEKKRKTRRRS